MMSGMPRRDSSTATSCARRVASAPYTLRNEPTPPARITSSPPCVTAGPVTAHWPVYCVNWPSFSSTVIRESMSSTKAASASRS